MIGECDPESLCCAPRLLSVLCADVAMLSPPKKHKCVQRVHEEACILTADGSITPARGSTLCLDLTPSGTGEVLDLIGTVLECNAASSCLSIRSAAGEWHGSLLEQ